MAELELDVNTFAVPGFNQQYRVWQDWLRAHGFYQGESHGHATDDFRQAMIDYQRWSGLSESGDIDMASWAKKSEQEAFYASVAGHPVERNPIDDKVHELYGPAMATYLDDAELGPILRQAAQEGWDQARLQGRMEQTDWWKRSSDTARQWELLKNQDPRTADNQRAQRQTEISNLMGQLGVRHNQMLLANLVEDSLRLGLSREQIQGIVASWGPALGIDAGVRTGQLHATIEDLRAYANSQYQDPAFEELQGQAVRIAKGELTPEGAKAGFAIRAKSFFPFLATSIDGGMTVADYFSEHRSRIAKALEVNVDSIDLMRDKKFWPVTGFVDGKGVQRPMTWYETQRFVNKLPEADQTSQLNQKSAETANYLRNTMLYGKTGS